MKSRQPVTVGPVTRANIGTDPNFLAAQRLQQQGVDLKATDIPSGLNKALSQILGAYQQKQVKDDYATRDQAYGDDVSHALGFAMGTPQQTDAKTGITWNEQKPDMGAASRLLMGNSDTQDLGLKLGLSDIDQKQAMAVAGVKRQQELDDMATKFNQEKTLKTMGDEDKTVTQDGVVYNLKTGKPVLDKPILPPGFNKNNGGTVTTDADGNTVITPGPGKLTESQGKAGNYVLRMENAEPDLLKPESIAALSDGWEKIKSDVPFAGNALNSPQYQVAMRAAQDYVNAVNRRDSGATVTPSEIKDAMQRYIPVMGDSPEVLAKKETARQTVRQGMMVESGGYFDNFKNKFGTNPMANEGKAAPAQDARSLMKSRGMTDDAINAYLAKKGVK